MSRSSIESLKIRAKLLQKSKKKSGKEIQLKDALQIVAKAKGFDSWRDLNAKFEETDLFNPAHWSAQWKVWYNTVDEARSHLKASEYLLPYHKQFFICDVHYINALGISLDDEDLLAVGNDWTIPKNKSAYERIVGKIREAQKVK